MSGNFLRIEASRESIDRATRELREIPGAINKAVPAAAVRTLKKARTFVVRRLATILTAPRKAIIATSGGKSRIHVIVLGAGENATARLVLAKRGIGLLNFKHTKTPTGIAFQLFKGGNWTVEAGSFIATGLNENRHVFVRDIKRGTYRQGKAHHKPNIGQLRQPIKAIRGVSLYTVYQRNPQWVVETQKLITEEFPRQLDNQVNRFLGRPDPDTPQPTEES